MPFVYAEGIIFYNSRGVIIRLRAFGNIKDSVIHSLCILVGGTGSPGTHHCQLSPEKCGREVIVSLVKLGIDSTFIGHVQQKIPCFYGVMLIACKLLYNRTVILCFFKEGRIIGIYKIFYCLAKGRAVYALIHIGGSGGYFTEFIPCPLTVRLKLIEHIIVIARVSQHLPVKESYLIVAYAGIIGNGEIQLSVIGAAFLGNLVPVLLVCKISYIRILSYWNKQISSCTLIIENSHLRPRGAEIQKICHGPAGISRSAYFCSPGVCRFRTDISYGYAVGLLQVFLHFSLLPLI